MNQEKNTKGIRSFTDLEAWKEGHKLVIMIYATTKSFPKEEQYGLTKQLRSAATSVTSNIAEGFSRRTYGEKNSFYGMSLGSLTEVQNQILIARDVEYMTTKIFKDLADQTVIVSKLLNGLIKKTQSIIDNS